MNSQAKISEEMMFASEESANRPPEHHDASDMWNVLVVDDEQGVHEVTKLALTNFKFDGKAIRFFHAYSAEEAKKIMLKNTNIAAALVDVVMETEHAGLDLVKYIRNDIKNNLIRIILRTGQPGQAPERSVIHDYDINDYKEKTELSAQKLYSALLTSLRSYRDLSALQANRQGLERVIRASGNVFRMGQLNGFIQGVLEQLIALLYLDQDSIVINSHSLALENTSGKLIITAATGHYAELVGKDAHTSLPPEILKDILESLSTRATVEHQNVYVEYFQAHPGREDVIYISRTNALTQNESDLVKLFLQNAAIAFENVLLRDEIEGTQRDIVYMLGESIETRSKETGQHVRRVAEYSRIIALGTGLSEKEAEVLHLAAPLHDFGKLGIPDSILHKEGKLDEAEWVIMKTHAQIGAEMLGKSKREILKAAAMLAGHHHEKWDGTGYPNGLKGEDIHIYGRIGALADVFDALGSRRCYKEPWPIEEVVKYLSDQRGIHFDPRLVDWILGNLDELLQVRKTFPDEV